jgi:chaperonin GroES
VVSIGPGRVLDTGERLVPSVKKGDVVLFTKYAGTEIEVDEEKLLLIKEPDILGIVHRDG